MEAHRELGVGSWGLGSVMGWMFEDLGDMEAHRACHGGQPTGTMQSKKSCSQSPGHWHDALKVVMG